MRQIWLIRHGESESNAGLVTDAPHSVALTPLGHQQAIEIARHFTREPELIVVSRYQRTTETARPTIERFPHCPIVEWPIHEFTFLAPGHYCGQTHHQRLLPARKFWERGDPDYCDGDGAESFNDFMARVRDCLDRMRQTSGRFIAIFTHGYVMKAMVWDSLYRGDRSPKAFMAGFHAFHLAYPVPNQMILPVVANRSGELFLGTPHLPTLRLGQLS
jgi:broad specificity phosphatase PhoE